MKPDQLALLDHPVITRTLFYPSPLSASDVPNERPGQIELIPAGSDRLGAYYFHPHPGAATVLFFHGNGEVMTDYLYGFHREIAGLGLNFLVVDYRGYGLSSGSPTLSRLLDDARAAWDHVTCAMNIAPSDLIVMGRSLGSLAALEIVSRPGPRPRGLVIESGIARFDQWIDRMAMLLGPLGLDLPALKAALLSAFDHEAKMKAAACPVLVLHAPHDEIVPVEHGRLLASYGDPGRTTLRIFPRGGHNDIQSVNHREYFQVLGRFFGETGGREI